MNRISQKFQLCREEKRAALVGFLTAGDPNPEDSFAIIDAACSAGLDLLELGVPFSDPTADGPVIQRASLRALRSGISLAKCLALAKRIRDKHPELPVILFGYLNPILAYDPKRLVHDAIEAGVDGLLCVDLPVEQFHEITKYIPDDQSFDLIRLIAPTTTEERMEKILPNASGFVYLQSRAGVTGVRNGQTASPFDFIRQQMGKVHRWTNVPSVVGFGISTPEDVAELVPLCNGVVVGSALISTVENNIHRDTRFFDCDKAIRDMSQKVHTLIPKPIQK